MPSSQPPGGPSPQGLTSAQVRQRVQAGQVNTPPDSPTKSVRRIVLENLFSFFNLIFYVIAGFLIAVGSFEELVFLLVVGANTAIGIIQELHSKKKLDELSLLSAPKATVIRNGTEQTIPTAQLVQDDRILLAAGNQISADAQVVSGSVQVNESLITGESDEITKGPGSALLSGSFVVSGRCQAVLTHVGAESYASQLTNEAKKSKKSHLPGMMRSLNRLLLAIGILIVPIGGALYYRQTSLLGLSVREGVETTAAAVIGMIPEGLYLMVSLALAASVLRLATKGTLVQDLKCTETLARVDVLCVDKTGTITQPDMAYCGLLPLTTELEETEIEAHLSDFVSNMAPDNETMQALQAALQQEDHRKAVQVLGFSSETKYSAVAYSREDCYVLGAPEFILGASGYVPYRSLAEEAMADGSRVLLFAACLPGPEGRGIADARPLAFVRLKNPVRETAKETFAYFHDQGVTVKVISGDNPVTVAAAANEAGIQGADKYVDASTLESYEDIQNACEEYNVFGRVKPNQKKLLVQALQENKHTVAMTGDGVNDVLALKEADLGPRADELGLCLHAVCGGRGAAGHQQHRAGRVPVSGEKYLFPDLGHHLDHGSVFLSPHALAADADESHLHRHPLADPGAGAQRELGERKVLAERHFTGLACGADGSLHHHLRAAVPKGLCHFQRGDLDGHGAAGDHRELLHGLEGRKAREPAAPGHDGRADRRSGVYCVGHSRRVLPVTAVLWESLDPDGVRAAHPVGDLAAEQGAGRPGIVVGESWAA